MLKAMNGEAALSPSTRAPVHVSWSRLPQRFVRRLKELGFRALGPFRGVEGAETSWTDLFAAPSAGHRQG